MLLGTIVDVAYGLEAKATAPIAWISRNAFANPSTRETSVPEASRALARPMLLATRCVFRLVGAVRRVLGRLRWSAAPFAAPQDVANDSETEEQHNEDAEDQGADALPIGVHIHFHRTRHADGDARGAVQVQREGHLAVTELGLDRHEHRSARFGEDPFGRILVDLQPAVGR